ncbi:MAG: hypothetical protein ACRCZM_04410 [Bacteroidales bacterium]
MKKVLCPKCKIANLYLKNEAGERLLIYVTREGEIVPKHAEESLSGFNTDVIYCLGCSWSGSVRQLVNY